MRQNKYEYDAFISHAVEDKMPIANELCAKLERAGLKIWYSGKELGVGDSIEKTIQNGLNRSRYGIVIFSPTYLAKNWTIREFYTLLAKEIEEHKVILPVLYNITLDDLKNKDLVMADRFAVNADRGIDFVVERLVQEIKKSYAVKTQQTWFAKLWFLLILSLLINVTFLLKGAFFPDQGQNVTQKMQSFEERDKHHNAINQRTFLGEVQGLFSQLNTCHCNPPDEGQAVRGVYKTGFSQNNDASVKRNGGYYDQEIADAIPNDHQPAGRKMTMALVFQMETLADTPPELQQEMDQLLNTVTLNAQTDPFITASNLAKTANKTKVHCSHATCLND